MKRVSLCVCVFLLCTLLSCSDNRCPTEPGCKHFLYPLKIGNSWKYSRVDSLFNFRQDTTGLALLNARLTHKVEVARTETLFDSIETYVCHEVITQETGGSWESERYYTNQNDGLYLHAYRGIPWLCPSPPRQRRIVFKGREFTSIQAIRAFIEQWEPDVHRMDDSLRLYLPPVKVLQYPLEVGAHWVIREAGNPWRVEKLVTGQVRVSVPAGDFTCYTVQTLVDFDNNGEWDEDIEYIDYVGPVGLARRYMFLKNLLWTNELGEVIGWFDVVDDLC